VNRFFNAKVLATGNERQYQIVYFNTNNYFTYIITFNKKVINATAGFYFNSAKESQIAFSASQGGNGFVNPFYKKST
jgi:hypothetical protein